MRKIRSENIESRVTNGKTCPNELSFLPSYCNASITIEIFQHESLLEVWNARVCFNKIYGRQKTELKMRGTPAILPVQRWRGGCIKTHSDCARWPPRRVSRNLFLPERPDKRGSYLQRVPSVRRDHSYPMKTVAHPSHTWLAAGETLHAVYILPLSTCDEDGHRALKGHARIRLPWKTYVQMSATKGGGTRR